MLSTKIVLEQGTSGTEFAGALINRSRNHRSPMGLRTLNPRT